MLTQVLSPELSLELLEPRHAEPLFRVVDRNREHLREWLPWLDVSRAPDDTLQFIRGTQRQFGENNGFQTAILVGGEIAGMIGHVRIDWAHRVAWLGYWLAREHQGRGYMTRACQAYVAHAFRDLRLNRVDIRAAVGNRRSRAIPERMGFTMEGVIRDAEWLYDHYVDHAVYGILAREWQGSP